MITDYQSLKDTVGRWLARETDTVFTSEVATFIQLAEAQMHNDLRARETICRAQGILNEEFEWLPESFLEMHQVSLITSNAANNDQVWTPLGFVEVDDLLKKRAAGGITSVEFYTVYGEQIRFTHPPSGDDIPPLEFEMVYWGRFSALNDTDNVNSILTAYPQIYLYGSLLQAEAFVMNDQRLALWKSSYDGAVETANSVAEKRRGTSAVGAPY